MSQPDSVGEQRTPERPETRTTDEEIVEERELAHERLSGVNLDPGARKTANYELLRIEAELVADGADPGNAAQPGGPKVAGPDFIKNSIEKLEEAGLEPAWRVAKDGDAE